MRVNRIATISFVLSWCTAVGSLSGASPPDAGSAVDFDRDIRPLFSNTCYTCHGPDENKRETDLRLDQKTSAFADLGGYAAVVAHQPEKSELIRRITSEDADERMPPPDSKQQLSPSDIASLKRWVQQGANWTEHWAFVPPRRQALPAVADRQWPRNDIDYFVLDRLRREGLEPSPPANKETLIRRLTLDLTGLPPTLGEIDVFLADQSPGAYETVVDRLLSSPSYGEHMALAWLEAARYADTNGYQQDRTRTMWPWRDWVVGALNENLPFDQFTIWQLAGDLLPDSTDQQKLATGFHRNHMLNGEGGRIAEESRVEYVIDRVDTTATVWLGLTAGCARCHDHKYDPITQNEFYQLFAYFNSIDESGSVDAGGNAKPVMKLLTPNQQAQKTKLVAQAAELEKGIAALAAGETLAQWERDTLAAYNDDSDQNYWQTLVPIEFQSEAGAAIELLDDASLFVSGNNPQNDNYTLQLKTDLKGITAIRLEALSHPSFTNQGLARSDSGNFVLTEFKVGTAQLAMEPPKDDAAGTATAARIVSAQADFEQNGHPVRQTFDGNPKTGWAVWTGGDMKANRTAVFVFDGPLPGGKGTTLTVTLQHGSVHKHHNLGRFRISVTTQPAPKLDGNKGFPEDVLAILKTERSQRSDEQTKKLIDQFRKTDPRAQKLQKQIEQAKNQLQQLENSAPQAMVMRERKDPRKTYRLIRGSWDKPDKSAELEPRPPTFLPPLPADAPKNRLGLARWLADSNNPLTARVTVNREWQRFFGRGLVGTAEDFGSQGERPSHAELLDRLAVEFISSGWDLKQLHRHIVTSATYRQSSKVTQEVLQRDPTNRWLGRAPRFRLSSQAIRDKALALSGLLVDKIGGGPVKPYQPAGVWSDLSLGKTKYVQDRGESLYRRSIYTFWRRASGPTMFFDTAARQVCTVRQSRTNTPLHALTLLNDTTFVEAARLFAERMIRNGGDAPAERIATAFRMATARFPKQSEIDALMKIYGELSQRFSKDQDAAIELLSVGETARDETVAASELAAYTGVMHVIFNLDEVISRE